MCHQKGIWWVAVKDSTKEAAIEGGFFAFCTIETLPAPANLPFCLQGRGITRLRSKKLISWSGQLLLIILIGLGISYWQQKDLIQDSIAAPNFNLPRLSGESVRLSDIQAERTLVYFFAPWCSICKLRRKNNIDETKFIVDGDFICSNGCFRLHFCSSQ